MTEKNVLLIGRVASSKGDAAYWLNQLQALYQYRAGMDIYPGSLNLQAEFSLQLCSAFSLTDGDAVTVRVTP